MENGRTNNQENLQTNNQDNNQNNNQNIDFDKIFEDGKEKFTFTKEKIFQYLDYSDHDPKQIIDSDILKNNNYSKILDFCFEEHFNNMIYSFQNGNYFFELNLIKCLNSYQNIGCKYFYININKIKKILHKKYSFKQYLGFWLAKLFLDYEIQESDIKGNENEDDNKSKYIEFVNNLCDSIFKNQKKYLEIILDILNNEFIKLNKIDPDENILVILNNLNPSDIDWIEKKRFLNLNILFIFNIQENFDTFQVYFYEETKYKKFFLENKYEISFKEPEKDCKKENFYSLFQSKNEYEKSKEELLNKTFKDYQNNEKLLNLAFIFNISQFINTINNQRNTITTLKTNLGISTNISFLKSFCSLFDLYVSSSESIIFKLEDIKFKEIYFNNQLKEQYAFLMVSYLNQRSDEFRLDDIKGPLLEKDIIFFILTGQIFKEEYDYSKKFKEVKVQSIFCLDYNKKMKYEDNSNNNVIITQESKTGEIYDLCFKINNHLKFCQISVFKDETDLEKLRKETISLDAIYFDKNKEGLNIGKIDSYSFVIITSFKVFKDYKDCKEKNKHSFFRMKEHCKKNNFEFYIYNYFENDMYIYDEINDNIKKSSNFFEVVTKINMFKDEKQLFEFINSSKKKYSLKSTNNLFYPIENYYQADTEKKIHFTSLAKYEFNPSMINMFTGINNIGLAFWNYKSNKQFDNLKINLNEKTEYFMDKKIVEKKPIIFEHPTTKTGIHSLIFLLSEENDIIDKETKKFLQKKRKDKDLYFGNFSELYDSKPKRQKNN